MCHAIACPNYGALLSWYEIEEHVKGCRPKEEPKQVAIEVAAKRK